jgi:RimJ/RimL family protein N-acetyltransferase
MEAFRIRDALPEDAAALISLRKAIFGETNFMLFAPNEYSASPEELFTQLAKIGSSGHSRSLLAEDGDTLIGFLGASGSPIPRLRHSAQVVVGVLRAHWGRGVGRALLAEIIRWAPTAGLSRLELFVMKSNSRAIAVYEQLGFRVEGHRRHAYVIDGEPVDDLLMAHVFEA